MSFRYLSLLLPNRGCSSGKVDIWTSIFRFRSATCGLAESNVYGINFIEFIEFIPYNFMRDAVSGAESHISKVNNRFAIIRTGRLA